MKCINIANISTTIFDLIFSFSKIFITDKNTAIKIKNDTPTIETGLKSKGIVWTKILSSDLSREEVPLK
jgi:hypothetical protein